MKNEVSAIEKSATQYYESSFPHSGGELSDPYIAGAAWLLGEAERLCRSGRLTTMSRGSVTVDASERDYVDFWELLKLVGREK